MQPEIFAHVITFLMFHISHTKFGPSGPSHITGLLLSEAAEVQSNKCYINQNLKARQRSSSITQSEFLIPRAESGKLWEGGSAAWGKIHARDSAKITRKVNFARIRRDFRRENPLKIQ